MSREIQFGIRKGGYSISSSNDKSPTSEYESLPMIDVRTSEQNTKNTLCGQSPELKGQPRKEDIKKWMQENIKLRPHQVTSKKRVKQHGFKNKIVQPEIQKTGKSRKEGEETKYGNGFPSFHKIPHQVTSKKRVKQHGFKNKIVQPEIQKTGKSRKEGEETKYGNGFPSFHKMTLEGPLNDSEEIYEDWNEDERQEREEMKYGNGFPSFDKIPANDPRKHPAEYGEDLKDITRITRNHIHKVVGKDENGNSEDDWIRSSLNTLSPMPQRSSSLPQPSSSLPQPSSSQLQPPQPPALPALLKFPGGSGSGHVINAKCTGMQQMTESEVETSSEETFCTDDEMYDFDGIISDEEEDTSTSESTDAFGEVKFVGYGRKIAKFVRADHRTSMETIIYLIKNLWSLSLPKLLISVTGGRRDFLLNSHLKEAFGYGLIKAARSTDAWIISAGLHTGVVKYTGKAIYNNENMLTGNNKLVTISVAPWNCVRNKDSLRKEEGSWPAEYYITDDNDCCTSTCPLDPNHSHFILVDDGTSDSDGVEIDFRKTLEDAIVQNKIRESEVKIPAVAVIVQGGYGTLMSVCDSLSRNIPVVIVKGSGRAADIMADAYQTVLENVDQKGKSITDGPLSRPLERKVENDIRRIIQKEFESYERQEVLVKCVMKCLKHMNLVTLFESDSAEDFDVVVLKALFKAHNDKLENLRLALEWNRIDIAKNELFTEEILWPTGTLDNSMLFALREDRVDFVKLFMEHGVSLKKLLTKENIESLYSMENKDISIKNGVSFLHNLVNDGYFTERKTDLLSDSFHIAVKLFLWAIYLNRKEMALLFWKEGMGALPSALIANNLLESLKLKCKDYDKRIQLQEHADLYEEHAIGVLTDCYYADEKRTLDLLLLQRKSWNNASCMQIAFNVNNKTFVSQAACQILLTKIWMGNLTKNNKNWKLLLCTLCPLFIFLLQFHDDDKQDNNEENNKSCCCRPCEKHCNMFCRCVSFYNTPVIKFLSNLIFYIIFLVIYSYVLLVEMKPQIFYLEWLLIVWVIGIFTEEIHQIFNRDMMLTKSSDSFCTKFADYISNKWNVMDVITIIMFIVGYMFRFLKLYDAARVMLSLNLFAFYIRFLNMLAVFKQLGPKLIMIKKMMQDLGYFIVILFILMIAYGIVSQSILYPSAPASYDLFKSVFRKAYFHMYAELFLEEYEENHPNCNVTSNCPSQIGTYIAPILMCIYILLTNILLLNLLIAMFSSTFQKVQEKSHLHWSFQKYELIFEFCIRPPLPPPFILLCNIFQFCRHLCEKARHKQPNKKSAFVRTYETDLDREKDLILWEDQIVDSYIAKKNKPDSNNTNLVDQSELSKYENTQTILFSEPEKEFTKNATILNQRLENIEEKINNINRTLTILKENLMERRH